MNVLRDERGSTSVLILGLCLALLTALGFAIDGTRKGLAYSQATAIAEEAARAGAQALRVRALAHGTDAAVEPAVAEAEAQRYIATSGATGIAHADEHEVVVDTVITRTTIFLGSVGIAEFTVHGHGAAVLVSAD
ncbi:pilus assembly protein TadG-related protein [Amycolatopsis sp. RTGN1]|uniref:pilus assembly protein TadG-related protein n=1 Tax=Amycolatopsis ponsaeliensis TaxID=2992142 RepID=UPI00254AC405|nr:pilus assembly protein TadG-related protein [Amycolatopsis sp. RTGN1]